MKKQKTVCFFVRLFYPHIGGVEKHVLEISKILVKKGYKINIICEKTPGRYKKLKGINVYKIPINVADKQKKYAIWKWLYEHRSLIKEADIIHCHDVFFWYMPFRFMYPLKPVFTTFHGYESYPPRKEAIALRKVSEKLSTGNIAVGYFMKKWYGNKADYVVYGGINKIKHYPSVSRPSALFIGRVDEQTGILDYDKAVRLVRRKIPGFVFTVAGDGAYKKQLKQKANFLGFVAEPEKYYRNHKFAFVSRYLAILEAFASRRLVFAMYDNPLKKDYLLKSPLAQCIVACESADELSSAILHFLKFPKQEQKIIDKAYKWVKNQTWEAVVEIYLKLWEKKSSLPKTVLLDNIDFEL